MPCQDWLAVRKAGVDNEREESRERWVQSAFIAWQLGAGEEQQTLGKYLEAFGLRDKPASSGDSKRKAQRAIAEAERIKAADRKRNG